MGVLKYKYYCPYCTDGGDLYDSILHTKPLCKRCGNEAIKKVKPFTKKKISPIKKMYSLTF